LVLIGNTKEARWADWGKGSTREETKKACRNRGRPLKGNPTRILVAMEMAPRIDVPGGMEAAKAVIESRHAGAARKASVFPSVVIPVAPIISVSVLPSIMAAIVAVRGLGRCGSRDQKSEKEYCTKTNRSNVFLQVCESHLSTILPFSEPAGRFGLRHSDSLVTKACEMPKLAASCSSRKIAWFYEFQTVS
jgi:hypothetical protein